MTFKNKAAFAAVITAALGAGSAHAATLNADMDITANVGASCALAGPGDQYFQIDQAASAPTLDTLVQVSCNLYLPYILETDAGPQGEVTLTDANTGKTLPVFLVRDTGGQAYTSPWGTQANGEEWAGYGTGTWEIKRFRMMVNHAPNYYGGGSSFALPSVGTYVQTVNFTLTY